MGITQYYGMYYFDFKDDLTTALNVQHEIDRFTLIDNQLYGLYNILGNGVISGWEVTDNGFTSVSGISIAISSGLGIINFLAAETTTVGTVEALPPNTAFFIYAVLQGATVQNRKISFTISLTNITSNYALKLAYVITGENSIISIDNTVRDLIGFEEIIRTLINQHKHRGTPSKIDLRNEVKNQLPGARIVGIDASKIVSGVFDIERIPILDHNDLENNGLLTHAALDTFVRSLSQSNKELLGEIASINLLKQIIFLKYKFDNNETMVDEHFINELILIPGLSPNSYIDFNSSTANINLSQKCISGVPSKVGRFESVTFDTQEAFLNNFSNENVIISNGQVTLRSDFTITDIIENFEGVSSPDLPIPGFTKGIVIVDDSTSLVSEGADVNKVEGFFSGEFTSSVGVRTIFKKEFSFYRNWNNFNELIAEVKTISTKHREVMCYFVNIGEDGEEIKYEFMLLESNEITFNVNSAKNNFEERIFDISSFNRDNVKEFVIYTDDTDSEFIFYLDNLFVRRKNLVVPEGSIVLRHSSEAEVTFYSIFFDAETPQNTSIEVRVRVASSDSLLSRAVYTLPLDSGDVFAIRGRNAEIEIVLLSTDNTISPTLDSVVLRMLVDADFHGFDIDDGSDFTEGNFENIELQRSANNVYGDSDLILKDPININGLFFGYKDSISEIDDNSVGLIGISGSKLPISSYQAANWANIPARKFNNLNSVIRKFSKHYLIADKNNHRILEVDEKGNLVRGFGSTYIVLERQAQSTKEKTNSQEKDYFYPLVSSYNPNNGILSIVFTNAVTIQDITKISLFYNMIEISLIKDEDIIFSTNKGNGKILEIKLSINNKARLSSIISGLTVFFYDNAFTTPIVKDKHANKLFGTYGIEVFVGNFTYIDGIRNPIFFNVLSNGNWIVANSSFPYVPDDAPEVNEESITVADIMEFDPTTLFVEYSTDKIKFSDFTLGSILEISPTQFVVAGIYEDSEALGSTVSGQDILDSVTIVTERTKFRVAAIDTLNAANIRSGIYILEKPSTDAFLKYQSPDGLYTSDISLDNNGNFFVAESAFVNGAGRIIKLNSFFNITFALGEGNFHVINDVKILENNNMILSL